MPEWLKFYENKRVFITGHTGFKGSWLCETLKLVGCEICGFALGVPTTPCLFDILNIDKGMMSIIGDIREFDSLQRALHCFKPDIVIHLAAQPIVSEAYLQPRYTYETNLMGTVNLLECIRTCDSVSSVIVVTTDKVYRNNDAIWKYRENDAIDGYDPYSSSKGCAELAVHSYANAFLRGNNVSISTARTGNVIGAGDFATNRIISDSVKAASTGGKLVVRQQSSIRPYQHVLESVYAYLLLAYAQYIDAEYSDWYNVGPDNYCTTRELVEIFAREWKRRTSKRLDWSCSHDNNYMHETKILRIDNSLIKNAIGWQPRWSICEAICRTIDWSAEWANDSSKEVLKSIVDKQIFEYFKDTDHCF